MQIMNVQQCGFSQKKTYVKIILSALVLIFFLCETKNIFLCLQEKWKLILLVKSCRRRSPAMILRPRYPNVCGEKSKQKLVISTRSGNEGSRIYHNHGEGPYLLLDPIQSNSKFIKGQAVWLAQILKAAHRSPKFTSAYHVSACVCLIIFVRALVGAFFCDCETCAKVC